MHHELRRPVLTAAACFWLGSGAAEAGRFWVSTVGSDSNPCVASETRPADLVARSRRTPKGGWACLAGPGDRLTILSGVYNAGMIKESAGKNGTAQSPIIVEGDPGDSPGCAVAGTCKTIFRPSSVNDWIGLFNSSYIVLRKFVVDVTLNDQSGIRSWATDVNKPCTGNLFEDIEIFGKNAVQQGFLGACHRQIWRRVHVHHTGAPGNQDHGIYIGSADDHIIEDSVFHDIGGSGVQDYASDASSDGRPDRTIIRRSKFYNNGIGVFCEGNDNQYYNNEIFNNKNAGIICGYSGALRAVITNNVIVNNGPTGIVLGTNFGDPNTGVASGSVVRNNILFGHGTEISVVPNTANVTRSHNACAAADQSQCSPDGGGVTISALTTCTMSAADFHPHAPPNPCIDAGTPITGHAYNGAKPDIGAYEYGSGTPVANAWPAKVKGMRWR